jgi:hypothetical protein
MHGIEPFRFTLSQPLQPHGTNLESCLFDALNDFAAVTRRNRVRLDDRKRQLHIRSIISLVAGTRAWHQCLAPVAGTGASH